MRRKILLLLALGGIAARPALAQSAPATTLDSYRKAVAVLDASIAAHGGDGRIRGLEDVSVAFDGQRHLEYQSFSLARPWQVLPNEWQLVLDFKNSRLRRDGVDRYPKDFAFRGRQVVTAEGGWWMDPSRQGTGDALGKIPRENFAGARNSWRREVPVLVLTSARDRAATLRSLGAVTEGGTRYDVITYAEDGAQVTLFIDGTSKLLARYELLRDDGIVGDQVMAVAFSDYRPVGGLQLPTRRAELRNGQAVREGGVTYAVNTHPHDSLFAPPATGYAEQVQVPAEQEAVRKLAENVWLVQTLPGGNKVMFVAFSDHVLVFEAPLPQAAAQAVMDAVKKTVPDKPIRYVTFSHHHDDHGGGLRPYIANGVTIVTTPKNRPFVQQVAAARHTIAPDTLSRAPRAPVIETFSGKRIFTDGSMTVELHELAPNSHVDEMVLAWLPRERLIFQGDLIIPPNQGEPAPANTLTREFLAKIDAMGWDVSTIAGVHGRVLPIQELRAMVAKNVAAQ